ncbi:S9 family peptidase [Sphingomonas sp. CGMCC 1.13654]|uniref:S9 family peptidase n=2 Tax=Sphingomonas chungangi TaxID=2683589 RepID=A0A838L4P4_9SPHN|nr:S9 family peptidase [Sphingomonas chungangi]MVW54885.1 prolyl oligopeptidase family serine peptidase [Sphingomonas chungangi]
MIDAKPMPRVLVSPDQTSLAIIGREGLPHIATLAKPILRLAGTRIDPATDGPAEERVDWLDSLAFRSIADGREVKVALPPDTRFMAPGWSPDGRHLAFVVQEKDGLALWIADRNGVARKLIGRVNAVFEGWPYVWSPDSKALVVRVQNPDRAASPPAQAEANAPVVQENDGRAVAAWTFEDLLQNKQDEALFDFYFSGRLERVPVDGGPKTSITATGLWQNFSISPDGRYLLTERLKRPYSYVLPANLFPTEIAVSTMQGQRVRLIADRPLADDLPVDFDARARGPREEQWRSDAPATLAWVEAQDGGDPKAAVPYHDRLLEQAAPFSAAPVKLVDLRSRYYALLWGDDGVAMAIDREWKSRTETRYMIAPGRPAAARLFLTWNYQDQYGDPGMPLLRANAAGMPVMQFTPDHAGLFMTGVGAGKAGAFPFLAEAPLAGGSERRLWTAQPPYYEEVMALLDPASTEILTRRESATEPPNYMVHSGTDASPRRVTDFADPMPDFAGVRRQSVTYRRSDGLPLSGTLYLPVGYDSTRDGPLPTLLWAYPAEFTDASVAGQTVDDGNRFIRPRWFSDLYLATRGYAVLDDPAMPIVGEQGAEPNDTYVQQLSADAKAAIDAVVALGIADRGRIAVGGHSYGAFMTANLLAHTDYFRAGLALSGAYNRTLTPFGFQAEQRTYWQAPDVYRAMSPFNFADRIKAPILLMHGEADDNPGTFPIQSERMYAALKGQGATVRYVVLPHEAHWYEAEESTQETLWQMTDWLDRYVKPAAGTVSGPAGAKQTPR